MLRARLPHVRSLRCFSASAAGCPAHAKNQAPEGACPVGAAPAAKSPARNFDEMPGPKRWPVVGSLPDVLRRYDTQGTGIFQVQVDLYREFGPIVRQRMPNEPPQGSVYLFHPDDMLKMYRSEGAFPYGAINMSWPVKKWSTFRDNPNNALFEVGPEWKAQRNKLNTGLFMPAEAKSYLPLLNEVSAELSSHFPRVAGQSLTQFCMLAAFDLFCAAMLGRSLHTIDPDRAKPMHVQFAKEAALSFHMLGDLMFDPWESMVQDHMNTPKFTKYKNLMDSQTAMAEQIVQEIIDDGLHGDSYLTRLLESGKWTPKEAAGAVVDLLGAAVDTTSTTLVWLLYDIARHPEAQAKLNADLVKQLNGGDFAGGESSLPYLKMCYRESLRYSPIGPMGTFRKALEDIELGGYIVPAGTHLFTNAAAMMLDERLLDDPDKFIPERWSSEAVAARKGTDKEVIDHKLLAANFSFGPRMCLGARLAVNEMYSVTARIFQDWEVTVLEPHKKKSMRLLLAPDPSPKLGAVRRTAF